MHADCFLKNRMCQKLKSNFFATLDKRAMIKCETVVFPILNLLHATVLVKMGYQAVIMLVVCDGHHVLTDTLCDSAPTLNTTYKSIVNVWHHLHCTYILSFLL